ncbi:MAG: hypothetical protein VZQ61_04580 [Christensenellaceae bacterium]
MEERKTLKQYAKEAKRRLKNGFWQSYHKDLDEKIERASEAGVAPSKVKEYYNYVVSENIKSRKDDEDEFYYKVKKILDEEGEISDAIGRLTDKKEFENLSYAEKQKYTLTLSERYLKAVERYNKEKSLSFAN